jgi:hypothetical protein
VGASGASDHRSSRVGRTARATYCALVALAIWPIGARAQEDCEATFQAELVRLRGADALRESERYRTTFADDGVQRSATIASSDGSSRQLSDPGPGCAALASATAVALALMLDAEPPPAAPMPPRPARAPWVLTSGAGAALLLGVPRDAAPALLAELGVRRGPWRLQLGALWALPRRTSFAPGTIRSELIAGSVRACWQPLAPLGLCTGAYLGALEMRARGYTRNDSAHPFWAAAPLELALDYVFGAVGAELGAGVLLPFQRQTFSIDGLGSAQASWPVQVLFSLRVFGLTKL